MESNPSSWWVKYNIFIIKDNENVIWLVNGELYNYIEDYPKL
jgi:hypothetical protein